MGVVSVELPEEVQQVVDREVAEGRAASRSAFLIEAAKRYADDLSLENEIVAEAEAGIADADAGRFVTIASPGDQEAHHRRTMARLRAQLPNDTA